MQLTGCHNGNEMRNVTCVDTQISIEWLYCSSLYCGPALDKTCRRSGKSGHFARVCRQQTSKPKLHRENARRLEQSDEDSSENECLFTLTAHNVHHRSDSLHTLEIEHIPVQMLIDSGASVNVLDLETYHRLKAQKGIKLTPSTLYVYAYGSTTPLISWELSPVG